MIFDPAYLLFVAPALILSLWAQFRIHSAYAQAQRQPAALSGAAAARHILDAAGLLDVAIEEQPGGRLNDHYDPRARVLRLSPEVYESRTLAAVGIAAHESGHAIQHAHHYAPLTIRNAVVPLAGLGSGLGLWMVFLGWIVTSLHFLVVPGILLFSTVVFFQLVNLPVEFDASARAKAQLVSLGIVPQDQMVYVNRVLGAAALTYVAATLEAVLTLVYLVTRSRH